VIRADFYNNITIIAIVGIKVVINNSVQSIFLGAIDDNILAIDIDLFVVVPIELPVLCRIKTHLWCVFG